MATGTGTATGTATCTLDDGIYFAYVEWWGQGVPGVGPEIGFPTPFRHWWATVPMNGSITFSGMDDCEDCD